MKSHFAVVALALMTSACGDPLSSLETQVLEGESSLIPPPKVTIGCGRQFSNGLEQVVCTSSATDGVPPYQHLWQELFVQDGVESPSGWYPGSTTARIGCRDDLVPGATYFFIRFQYRVIDANNYDSNIATSSIAFRCLDFVPTP
ncbi:hypothetical protein ACN469_32690 [Corallococcus terminator]